MKLELKHLASYLPYTLKGMFNTDDIIKYTYMVSLSRDRVSRMLDNGSGYFSVPYKQFKPILRPLSDLTKEIEHNGEKFIPSEIIENTIRRGVDIYKPLNIEHDIEFSIETEDYSQSIDLFDGYKIAEKLFEWHFDVFGLIDAGLAIDINTLPVNG